MHAKYCNAICQKNHWPKHKKECKLRAAELRDKALFKDPPSMDDCPICFLPMPKEMVCCASLPPATISSVPIYDFVHKEANDELANVGMAIYYSCCGKSICGGCVHSFAQSGNMELCPFCKSERTGKIDDEFIEELTKRVEANDAGSMAVLANQISNGGRGLQQDRAKALALYVRAADLGSNDAHYHLGILYKEDSKKAKFHYEAAAMAGHEAARCTLGTIELNSGNVVQAVKHWMIAASAGEYRAMHFLLEALKRGYVSRDTINSSLEAYNNACAEMRSKARDAFIRSFIAEG
jgi:hypothetical protein